MNPFFVTDFSISDSLKTVRKSVLIYETIIEILLEITEAHYSKSELSTNKDHPNDVVHVFKIQEDLMPRFVENSSYENVCIYVKITWPDGMKPMFIISFHEDEE